MMEENEVKLEKQLSSTSVWALAFGCIIGWGAFVMPGDTFLGKAGPFGTLIAIVIAALIMIVIAINYNFMLVRFPVAGGEFTYADNAFGRDHAFICAWFLGLSYLAIVPLNGTALALIGRNLLNNIFQVGFHYTVAGYDVYLGEILLADAALLLFGWLSIRGSKTSGIFQTILTVMLVAGVMVIGIAAVFSPKTAFENLYPAFDPGTGKIAGVLGVVAVAPWAFVGFDTVPQAAEEFNFPPRKTIGIMVLSIVFGAGVYIVLNTVTASVIPVGYTTWVEYIDDLPNLSGLISLPTFNAAKTLLGTPGLIFIGVAVLAAILSGIIGFYMATSRLLYSMSQKDVLPVWFGKLHPKYKTPSNAILFVLLISLGAPFFGRNALGWIVDMSSAGAAIGYAYTSAAALKFSIQEKNKWIVVTGILGTILGLLFLGLLLVPLPGLDCSLGKESYICLAIWIVLGIIFYISSKKK